MIFIIEAKKRKLKIEIRGISWTRSIELSSYNFIYMQNLFSKLCVKYTKCT